jgi:hypothetical protein
MSYIGNNPDVNVFTIGVDRFNGTGACTEFILTRDIDDAKAIEVIVNGVQQDPDNAYTVTNGLITFSEAPSSGTDNITVTYRAPVVVTFNQVTTSQLQANAVTSTAIASNAVTTIKIAQSAVTGDKIPDRAITSNNIVEGSITSNLIATNTVAGNNIVPGTITGNLIASGTIAGNAIGVGQITGNLIADFAISANNLTNPDNFEDSFLLGGM